MAHYLFNYIGECVLPAFEIHVFARIFPCAWVGGNFLCLRASTERKSSGGGGGGGGGE